VSRFTQRLEAGAATWTAAADPGEAVSAVLGYLHAAGLPPRLVISAAAAALELPWPPDAEVRVRAARADEPVALLLADAGIAETGSVVLSSGPASPTTLALLPDHLICLLRQQDLLAYPEDLWRRLRGQPLPRALVLLTGPSRTADVEQTLQLGAHGARRLHLVLLG
jgi:L-lactate dehydrogenase complex protein LldG